MKRERDITTETPPNLIGTLPVEMVVHLVKFLDERGVFNLGCVDRHFAQFCRDFNLTAERRCLIILDKIHDRGEILNTPQKRLKAIRRGQTTVYQINLKSGEDTIVSSRFQCFRHVTGIESLSLKFSYQEFSSALFFCLAGSPPPKGTKIWIFGCMELEETEDGYLPHIDGHWEVVFNIQDKLLGYKSNQFGVAQSFYYAVYSNMLQNGPIDDIIETEIELTTCNALVDLHERIIVRGETPNSTMYVGLNLTHLHTLLILQEIELP